MTIITCVRSVTGGHSRASFTQISGDVTEQFDHAGGHIPLAVIFGMDDHRVHANTLWEAVQGVGGGGLYASMSERSGASVNSVFQCRGVSSSTRVYG